MPIQAVQYVSQCRRLFFFKVTPWHLNVLGIDPYIILASPPFQKRDLTSFVQPLLFRKSLLYVYFESHFLLHITFYCHISIPFATSLIIFHYYTFLFIFMSISLSFILYFCLCSVYIPFLILDFFSAFANIISTFTSLLTKYDFERSWNSLIFFLVLMCVITIQYH